MAHNISDSQEMPYFIKPSKNLSDEEKTAAYETALDSIRAVLSGEDGTILKMATINCLLKTHLPYAYWIGFYCVNDGKLSVGPYQGTLGCLHIAFGKGVCGAVAISRQTKIVDEVHLLAEGEDHITCDPNSQSEIVVPVFDKERNLIAVFDIDSSQTHSFNEIDQTYLELITKEQFAG
jgi:L-methionine (R)-S-oxide reductase